MALCRFTPTQKNRKAFTTELLINTNKVCDFYASGTSVIFYYAELEDGRTPTIEYKTTSSRNAFHSKVREAANEKWVQLDVTQVNNKTHDGYMTINTDKIVKGWDIDTASCYLEIERGQFDKVLLKTTHTIAEIDDAASASRVLSAS